MVKGPGTVIFTGRLVCRFKNARSSISTACLRRIRPTMRGTGFGCPERSSAVPGLSRSTPSSAVANRFATALEGVDLDKPGTALDRSGHPNPVPRIVGRIRRRHAVEIEDLAFLKRHTSRPVKMTVPGPFTMFQQAQNDFYRTEEEAAMDYAAAVNEEIHDLFAAGA